MNVIQLHIKTTGLLNFWSGSGCMNFLKEPCIHLNAHKVNRILINCIDDDCERLWWKRLQEYNPEQRLWKYLSTLAEGNAELDDNMPFEDELGEDDYYPSLPFAALFSCFKTYFVTIEQEIFAILTDTFACLGVAALVLPGS
ncbi:hypothetical protein LOK49_LG04G02629 [Camellia lanceoleosa]|uniref:Uncharacterized protein n=1 Tax=Camellia lanceoleosa TaxID=1840588 RepID=A0ACC0HYD8_9ERIC|nr:hypothetical protein LOK49_LG04G02629 [Camellia lanceoleosa]